MGFYDLCEALDGHPPDAVDQVLATALGGPPARIAVYLADYAGAVLLRLPSSAPAPERLPDDESPAWVAYRTNDAQYSETEGVLWVPIARRGSPTGVLRLETEDTTEARDLGAVAGRLAGVVLGFSDPYTSVFDRARRRAEMGMAAELQWSNLPPTTYQDGGISVAAALEPAYDIGGDALDYAVSGTTIEFAQFDAIGHGAAAAMMSLMALGSWRAARCNGRPLTEAAVQIARDLHDMTASGEFVSGVVGSLERSSGRLEWINAGHPHPFILRTGSSEILTSPVTLPFGAVDPAGVRPSQPQHAILHEGATLVLASDGLTGNADSSGASPTVDELIADLLSYHDAKTGHFGLARHAVSRVIDRSAGSLDDDATILTINRSA